MNLHKRILDRLASEPEMALSFDEVGNEIWTRREALTEPVDARKRRRWTDFPSGQSTDGLMFKIAKMNPGMQLQLRSSNGIFPYMALHMNGLKEQLKLPEGVHYYESGFITVEWEGCKICLLEAMN